MHVNRGLVFWGVALITAGAVALALQAGWIDGSVLRDLWRFWPIALIAIGLAIIAARTPFVDIALLRRFFQCFLLIGGCRIGAVLQVLLGHLLRE